MAQDSDQVRARERTVSRLGRGMALGYVSLFASLLTAAFMAPFIARSIGPEHYGVWVLIGSIVGYISLFDLGLNYGVTRYTARLVALADHASLEDLIASALTAYCLLGFVAGAAILIGCLTMPSWLGVPAADLAAARAVLLVLGINAGIGLPLTLLRSVLRGYQRFAFLALTDVSVTMSTAIASVLVIAAHAGIAALAVIALATNVCRGLAHVTYVRATLPHLRLGFRSPMRAGQLLGYSACAFIIAACAQVVFASDAIVVGAILSLGAVAIYGVAQKLVDAAAAAVFQGVDTLFPLLTEYDAAADAAKVQAVFKDAVTLGLAMTVPITICAAAFGDRLLSAWAGPYYSAGYVVIAVLSLALLFHVPGHVAAIVLLSMNRHGMLAVVAIGDALTNLALSIVLGKTYGLVGVALGTAVSMLLSNVLVVPIMTCRELHLPFTAYLSKTIRPVLMAGAIPTTLAFLLRGVPDAGNLFSLARDLTLTLGVSVLSCWLLALTPAQRVRYRQFAREMLVRGGGGKVGGGRRGAEGNGGAIQPAAG